MKRLLRSVPVPVWLIIVALFALSSSVVILSGDLLQRNVGTATVSISVVSDRGDLGVGNCTTRTLLIVDDQNQFSLPPSGGTVNIKLEKGKTHYIIASAQHDYRQPDSIGTIGRSTTDSEVNLFVMGPTSISIKLRGDFTLYDPAKVAEICSK